MADTTKYIVGFLLVIVTLGVVTIELETSSKLRVDNDKSTFYVPQSEGSKVWVVSGREYNRLFEGTKILGRDTKTIKISNIIQDNSITITRYTKYLKGPEIIDTYTFFGNTKDVELFPVSHKIEVKNAKGYFYRYTVDELTNTIPKTKLINELSLSFGKNMKVDLQEGYRWAWIGYPYGSDSISAQYEIDSNYKVFYMKLYDPIIPDVSQICINTTASRRIPVQVQQEYTCSSLFNFTSNPKYAYCFEEVFNAINNTKLNKTIFEHSFDTGFRANKTIYWKETQYTNENYNVCKRQIGYDIDGKTLDWSKQGLQCKRDGLVLNCDSCEDGNCDGIIHSGESYCIADIQSKSIDCSADYSNIEKKFSRFVQRFRE